MRGAVGKPVIRDEFLAGVELTVMNECGLKDQQSNTLSVAPVLDPGCDGFKGCEVSPGTCAMTEIQKRVNDKH